MMSATSHAISVPNDRPSSLVASFSEPSLIPLLTTCDKVVSPYHFPTFSLYSHELWPLSLSSLLLFPPDLGYAVI